MDGPIPDIDETLLARQRGTEGEDTGEWEVFLMPTSCTLYVYYRDSVTHDLNH